MFLSPLSSCFSSRVLCCWTVLISSTLRRESLSCLDPRFSNSKNEKNVEKRRKHEFFKLSNKWRFAPPSSPALWSRARYAPCVDPLSDPNAGWTVWFGVLEQAIRIYVSGRFHMKYGQMIFCKFDISVGAWKSCSSLADVFCLIFAMFWRSKNFNISWSYEAKYFGYGKHLSMTTWT